MTKQQQYSEYQKWGGTMTIEEWEQDGRYDEQANPTRITVNGYPIDDDLRNAIANIVTAQIEKAGIEVSENFARWYKDECSNEIIENVLESVVQWEMRKKN